MRFGILRTKTVAGANVGGLILGALKLLGSWAATADPAESAHATDQS